MWFWFVVMVFHRKIRLTQLWVELGCGKNLNALVKSLDFDLTLEDSDLKTPTEDSDLGLKLWFDQGLGLGLDTKGGKSA